MSREKNQLHRPGLHRADPSSGRSGGRSKEEGAPSGSYLHTGKEGTEGQNASAANQGRAPLAGKTSRPKRRLRRSNLHAPVIHNTEFTVISSVFVALFIAVGAYFIHFMVQEGDYYRNNAYNPRLSVAEARVTRGDILSSDGKVLASSKDGNRSYPFEDVYAHAVGYNSNGKGGVELQENDTLLRSHVSPVRRIQNLFAGKKDQGDNVTLTLDSKIQQAAYSAIGNHKGAVVVLDPDTGKILAMVSKPDFDPNKLEKNWDKLSTDKDQAALVNRANQGLYPPGSTFKIVTSLAYLRQNNGSDHNFSYDCTGTFSKDGYTIHCFGNEKHGRENLTQAFGNSCNTAFSNVGLSLNYEQWKQTAGDMLFDTNLPTDLSNSATSKFQLAKNDGAAAIMQTAIGQGNTLVTPIHMAMLASAVANGGKLMRTYIKDKVTSEDGLPVYSAEARQAGQLMTSAEADQLKSYMRYVVTNGTARSINSKSYTIYGKTGTAEYNSEKDSHSWFVGFAEQDQKKVAVAVILEEVGGTSTSATSAAGAVFKACF